MDQWELNAGLLDPTLLVYAIGAVLVLLTGWLIARHERKR